MVGICQNNNATLVWREELGLNKQLVYVKTNVQVNKMWVWWQLLVNRSVAQVFHNSVHKVASGTVSSKVSCPYLRRAHTQTQSHGMKGYKEELKDREVGKEGARQTGTFCFKC